MRRVSSLCLLSIALGGCSDDGTSGDDEVGEDDGAGLIDGPGCRANWFELDGPPLAAQASRPEHHASRLATGARIEFVPATPPVSAPISSLPESSPAVALDFATFAKHYAKPVAGGWLIETDQFVSTERLKALYEDYTRRSASTSGDAEPTPVLAVYDLENTDLAWSGGRKLELTWCLGRVFPKPTNADYQEQHDKNVVRLVRNVERATRAWERAGDVNFTHLHEYDSPEDEGSGDCQPGENGIFFRVRMGPECRSACLGYTNFAPDTEFQPQWASATNPEGTPREFLFGFASLSSEHEAGVTAHHELGHVLGFAHEHLRFPQEDSSCTKSPFDWRGLTPEDTHSVMGYGWCDGIAPEQPHLSAYDRLGAYFQYSWGHRRPLMMDGGSSISDYAYEGTDRTSLLWYEPRATTMDLWVSAGEPGEPIAFQTSSRCLDGSNPPCATKPDPHGLFRPSPVFGTGTRNDLDTLLLAPGSAMVDRMLFNDGSVFDSASFPLDSHPIR